MSYGVKYRIEFKDHFNRAIKVDISKDGYSSTVTSVTPTADPLSIEWPGQRGDIFAPVRGAICRVGFYAASSGQFDEFFTAKERQFKVEVYVSASLYWSGWMIPGEHQEALEAPPYAVSISAYDLGGLQSIPYEAADYEDSTILEAVQNCLDGTDLGLDIKERVNIYEDSTYIGSPATADSTFEDIKIHNTNFFSYEFVPDSKYEALQKLLKPFNAFIMQESGVWNICRVGDMAVSHNYRVFNSSGTKTSSGSEDTRFNFSTIDVMNRSGLLMGTETWRNLNFKLDQGLRGLVPNPLMEQQPTASDLWTTTGTWDYTTLEDSYVLRESVGGLPRKEAVLKKTYSLVSTTIFAVSLDYELRFVSASGSPTYADIVVKYVPSGGGSTQYLDIQGGTGFSTTSSVVQVSGTEDTWISGTASGNIFSPSGTLSIEVYSANHGANQGYTYFKQLELTSSSIKAWTKPEQIEDLSKVIDTDNLYEPDEVIIYFGDAGNALSATDDDAKHFLNSVLRLQTGNTPTDAWDTNTGAGPDTLQQICADCYEDQYEDNALRLQGTLRCQKNYLDVITYDSKQLLATSLTRNFRDSDLIGEWIEIKST